MPEKAIKAFKCKVRHPYYDILHISTILKETCDLWPRAKTGTVYIYDFGHPLAYRVF